MHVPGPLQSIWRYCFLERCSEMRWLGWLIRRIWPRWGKPEMIMNCERCDGESHIPMARMLAESELPKRMRCSYCGYISPPITWYSADQIEKMESEAK